MKSSSTSRPPTARRSRSRSGPSGGSPTRPSSSGRSRTVPQRRVARQGVRPQHRSRHDHHEQPVRDRPEHQPQDDVYPRACLRKWSPGPASPARNAAVPTPDQAMLDFIVPPEAKESVSLGRLKITDQIKENAQHALAQEVKAKRPAAASSWWTSACRGSSSCPRCARPPSTVPSR